MTRSNITKKKYREFKKNISHPFLIALKIHDFCHRIFHNEINLLYLKENVKENGAVVLMGNLQYVQTGGIVSIGNLHHVQVDKTWTGFSWRYLTTQ